MENKKSLRRYDVWVHWMRIMSYFLVGDTIAMMLLFPESWKLSYGHMLAPVVVVGIGLLLYFRIAREYVGRNQRGAETMPVFLLGIGIWGVYYAYSSNFLPMYHVQVAFLFGMLEMWLVGGYMANYASYIRKNTEVSEGTLKQMTDMNHGLFGLWNLIVLFVILIAWLLPIWGWTSYVKTFGKRLLVSVLRFIFREKAVDYIPETEETFDPGIVITEDSSKTTSEGLLLLISVLGFLVFLAFVIYAVCCIYQHITNRYVYEEDQLELLSRADGKVSRSRDAQKQSDQAISGTNGRIRKLFRKSMRKRFRGQVPETMTPQELSEGAWNSGEEYSSLYEKARYSTEACSEEEVHRMKQLHDQYLKEKQKYRE